MPVSSKLAERLFTKVDMHGGDTKVCWEWQGATGGKDKRPIMRVDNKIMYVSRIVYELYNGKEPGDLVVRHTCDNHICVNPTHLILGTQQQNVEDMAMRQRANIYSYKEVQMCRAYLMMGWGPTAVAELMHKKISWVHDLQYERRHKHLPPPIIDKKGNILDWRFDLETGFINEEPVSQSHKMKYGEPDADAGDDTHT